MALDGNMYPCDQPLIVIHNMFAMFTRFGWKIHRFQNTYRMMLRYQHIFYNMCESGLNNTCNMSCSNDMYVVNGHDKFDIDASMSSSECSHA